MKILAAFIILISISGLYSAPGDLDITFGSGTGVVLTGFGMGSYDPTYSAAIQTDGKLVLSGYTFDSVPFGQRKLVIVRYNADGSLDSTFATGGKFVLTIPNWPPSGFDGSGVCVMPNGMIVASGLAGSKNIIIVRLNSIGQLDTNFGTSGIVNTSLESLSAEYAEYKFRGMAVSNEGKIAIAGDAVATNEFTIIAVYTSEGEVAPCGILTAPSGINWRQSRGIAFEGEKIVWMGTSGNNLVIERYLDDGSPDTTLNGNGAVFVQYGTTRTEGYALLLQPDGKIVVAGQRLNGTSRTTFISRFNQNGLADTGFGTNGVAYPSLSGFTNPFTYGLAIQANGKLLLSSTAANRTGFALLRLQSNGTLDSSFGQAGVSSDVEFIGDPLENGYDNSPRSIAISNTGSIYVTGSSNGSFDGANSCDFAVAKYQGDPTLTDIEKWRFLNFGNSDDFGVGADDSDFDKDGLKNLAEFAFGLDPKSGQSLQTPVWGLVGNTISVTFETPSGVSQVVYGAEWSSSLTGNWNPITDTGIAPQHVFAIPKGISNPLFVRLKVTRY